MEVESGFKDNKAEWVGWGGVHLHSNKKYTISDDYTITCPQMITTFVLKLLILFGIRWFYESKPLYLASASKLYSYDIYFNQVGCASK